jgi:hypothetical protein
MKLIIRILGLVTTIGAMYLVSQNDYAQATYLLVLAFWLDYSGDNWGDK